MKSILYIFIPFMFILNSCSESFLTEEPEISVTNNNFWKTDKDFQAATMGLHSLFRSAHGNVVVQYRDRGLIFDNLALWQNPCNNELARSWGMTNANLDWRPEYQVITFANEIIFNLKQKNLATERYNYYMGQALGLRAYIYFYILRVWGDAPLILNPEETGEMRRTSWQEIATQCIMDLQEAAKLLPHANALKDVNNETVTSKQIISRGTTHAILAHLYAWKASLNDEPELNQLALSECDSVLSYKYYQLAENIRDVCEIVMLGNSDEGIFELDYRDTDFDFITYGSRLAGFCQSFPIVPLATPQTKRRNLRINNKTVYALYPDANDDRRKEYFYNLDYYNSLSTSITQGAAYIQKIRHYTTYNDGIQVGRIKSYLDNEIIIRLADIILLRAELKEKTGDRTGAKADLNVIRQRANTNVYDENEGSLKEAIQNERDRELFLEGINTRFFDMVRNGMFREKLRGKFKTLTDQDVKDGALFLPIDAGAFDNNTRMIQTTYWKRHGYPHK
ncbi:RagB/SusD family nutrient uptake outer membrane protein [Butyricimonas faecihominis]|jgi:hypothetical protein|uniref:RagB/SusD family nutrient uptake outer membrane protein n=1 Tax=Butyricimonas faecihominis TaxID=1472416 RepID=UPI00266FC773|nr:RagB/SusD family nutrient uptake outer membrane protein [Butyricimonas faecihominis]